MNLDEIKDILRLLDASDIVEFELEQEGVKLRVRKKEPPLPAPAAVVPLPAAAPVAASPTYLAAPPAAPSGPAATEKRDVADEDGLVVVRSPIVGTFYRTPDPSSPPFVEVGDRVKAGQVICIIEAMKLMNEIEAEVAGTIAKIHREAGQPVQYGDALFSIRQD